MSAPADETPQVTAPAAGGRSHLHRTWGERLVLTVGVVATVVALLSAGVLAWGLEKWSAIESFDFGEDVGEAAEGEPANWLLVGSDSREGIDSDDPNAGVILGEGMPEGKRTDTILVARIDPEADVIHLLSIPRDLWVDFSDGGEGRINAAFNGEGGEKRLLETVESTFGIDINHYAEINFAGFQDVIEAIGGVPIWFDRPMRDAGSGLSVTTAGCHVLNGSQALAFARGRNLEYFQDGSWHTDGTGDLGRNNRQQYLLRRMSDTAVSHLDITELGTINRLLEAGGSNLTRDQTIGPDDLLGLALTFSGLSSDQIIGHALPVFDFRSNSGAAVLGLDTEAAQPVLDIFRGSATGSSDGSAQNPPAVYQVNNGSGVAGQAGEVASELNDRGLDVPGVGNHPTRIDRTLVIYPPGYEAEAARIASYLASGADYQVDPDAEVITLVTGSDFSGVLEEPNENVEAPAVTEAPPAAEEPDTAAGTDSDADPDSGAEEAAPDVEQAPVDDAPIGVVPAPAPEGTACE